MSGIARAVAGMMVLGCAFVPAAAAQKAGEITIGVMAGANYSKVTQDPEQSDVTLDYKTGLVAGGFVGFQVTDVFSIEPQVLYSQKGTELKGSGSNSSVTGSVRLNYLEVPVLGKFWIPISNSQLRPFLFAGPEFEYLISCSVEGAAFGITSSTDCDKTTDVKIKSTDFGATFGGGVQFMAGRQVVRLDARYTLGLTDINDSTGDDTKVKNRAFTVTAGLGFPVPR